VARRRVQRREKRERREWGREGGVRRVMRRHGCQASAKSDAVRLQRKLCAALPWTSFGRPLSLPLPLKFPFPVFPI
jgi:hypothetical protein